MWEPCEVRWKGNMVNLWNRILDLPADRIASRIFKWNLSIGGEWGSEILELLQEHGHEVVKGTRYDKAYK